MPVRHYRHVSCSEPPVPERGDGGFGVTPIFGENVQTTNFQFTRRQRIFEHLTLLVHSPNFHTRQGITHMTRSTFSV